MKYILNALYYQMESLKNNSKYYKFCKNYKKKAIYKFYLVNDSHLALTCYILSPAIIKPFFFFVRQGTCVIPASAINQCALQQYFKCNKKLTVTLVTTACCCDTEIDKIP